MPLRKLPEPKSQGIVCLHSEHNPPGGIVLDPGVYEWVCPGCGKATQFRVPERPSLNTSCGVFDDASSLETFRR